MYTRQCQAPQEEEISCDKYKRKMTASAASEQIDLERNGERGGRENEREKERQVVSGTIQLPSELYWISPPFKIKRQISLNPPLDPRGRITLFFSQPAQEPCTLCLPPFFQRVLHITLSTVEFYYLSYAFLNTTLKNSKYYYNFFSTAFFTTKKKLCVVCVYVL